MSSRRDNVIQSIYSSNLRGVKGTVTNKQELTAVSSYNWLQRSTPTICVPGSPPLWIPKPSGTRLNPDTGRVFIDQNAYRNPIYPLEPLFRAVYTSNPGFDFSKIDLITDRNNLRKLLNFVTGNPKAFRIEVERVGGTTLFTRCEEKTSEHIFPGEFRGFGHQFEENYTKWPPGTEHSTGHHRIVRYKFGGLRCLVRFEVDASLHGFVLNLVSQGSIAEIKTRAAHRQLDMSEVLPQLWFSHTATLVVGYHRGGRFDDVKQLQMDHELEDWEGKNIRNLERLAQLLNNILDAANSAQGGKCSIVYRGDTKLDIVEVSAEKYTLPKDIRDKLEASKLTKG
ncbi:hypothetical protein K440DRAFT_679235 [Wilcoxina mikolae CBS 423.85]|nr:hypothetical protein K440DRAFT_679235 [Wilcoxina mikolae CBS 423.85]